MAFQMIPPRLSSSPPPLDSLPPVACPGVDEDDEFDHFSSHNASFDITGLSDKLPPTPESSPTKFPGLRLGPATERGLTEGLEGTLEDSISQDSGVDSSNHPHEFSPQPQGDGQPCSREDLSGGEAQADREFSDSEQNDVDDFGDFQSVCVAGAEASGSQECSDTLHNAASNNKSDGQVPSQLLSQECESAKCEESEAPRHRTNSSPPPLDCVAESTGMDDAFPLSFIRPEDEDADFGDFTSHEPTFDLNSDGNHQSDTSPHPSDLQPDVADTTVESNHESLPSSQAQEVINTERLQDESVEEEEDSACKPDRDASEEDVSVGEDDGESLTYSPHTEKAIASDETLPLPETKVMTEDGTATSAGNVDKSFRVNRALESSASDSANNEARTGDKVGVDSGSPSVSGIDSMALKSDDIVEGSDGVVEGSAQRKVGQSSNGDTTKQFDDVCGSDHDGSDFGDFNRANDDDDDDLDFADLRKQVESGSFDDFGDFSSGLMEGGDAGVGGNEENSDDFGDFAASADTVDKAEFGDFGDFEGHAKETGVDGDVPEDLNDDFGDFTAPKSSEEFQEFTAAQGIKEMQFPPSEDGVSMKSPVLQKLESLIAKWIPSPAAPPQEESCPVPLLRQAIESDAFVWRQLENLESSAALRLSWSSSQAHTYFLSSVNVDARNIVSKAAMITLFGQKWSSSVPLFAQTLSFSPLTPAKSSEGGSGGGGSGGVGFAGTTKEPSPDSSPAITVKHGLHKKDSAPEPSSTRRTDRGSEEQIPPAKFDWTSSGLTNPLEGPGLEQEFLSEGGEKGSVGRPVKSPPTPSPLVQQILGGGMNKAPTPTTPLQSLPPEVRQVVTQLPDLSFMRSRVLMFPIRGEQ